MANTKECFIIMPITVPKQMSNEYRDGEEHFKHVLDCLFIPAAQKAGYNPKPPKAKGADIIHGEIVRSIETADLVLCDMSCLNPNVFFEFGIRTALNKSVCVIKDDKTDKIPFDAAVMNCQDYVSSIEAWNVEVEIDRLVEHIKTSAERNKGENNFWKYFGLKSKAVPYESEDPVSAKLDYLRLQADSSNRRLADISDIVMQLQTRPTPITRVRTGVPVDTTKEMEKDDSIPISARIWNAISPLMPEGAILRGVSDAHSLPQEPGIAYIEILYKGRLDKNQRQVLSDFVWHMFNVRTKFNSIDDNFESKK